MFILHIDLVVTGMLPTHCRSWNATSESGCVKCLFTSSRRKSFSTIFLRGPRYVYVGFTCCSGLTGCTTRLGVTRPDWSCRLFHWQLRCLWKYPGRLSGLTEHRRVLSDRSVRSTGSQTNPQLQFPLFCHFTFLLSPLYCSIRNIERPMVTVRDAVSSPHSPAMPLFLVLPVMRCERV